MKPTGVAVPKPKQRSARTKSTSRNSYHKARHVEVQILGDRTGRIVHLGERECSIQRRFQKFLEIAPAPGLDKGLREQIIDAAVRFAKSVGYRNLGTFEFLVDVSGANRFVFIEANARLQVEHTVTEAVTGVDLVQTQIRLAQGATLGELGVDAVQPRGYAIQARVNMETIGASGETKPSGGTLTVYEAPSGPGVRTDGFGYAGYRTSSAFDSLLAKVIVHSPSPEFTNAVGRIRRALNEFRIDGIGTNIPFLQSILAHADFAAGNIHTRWVDENMTSLATEATVQRSATNDRGFAGARVNSRDPLALFAHDAQMKTEPRTDIGAKPELQGPDRSTGVASPIQGTIAAITVSIGDAVRQGQQVAVVEAMKMEHVIYAPHSGIVRDVTMAPGDVVREGFPLCSSSRPTSPAAP